MLDLFEEIWGSLMRNKIRTIATGIAVASGLFLLIVLLGASNGIIHTLEANGEDLSLDAIHLWPGYTSKPYHGLKEGRAIKFDDKDLHLADKNFTDRISSTSATIEKSGTASMGKEHVSVSIEGVYPDYTDVATVSLLRGRFINHIDMQERRRVIIIAEDQEETLFGKGVNGLGRSLKIGNLMFKVIGVMKKDYGFSSSTVYAPFTTIQTIYASGNNIDKITLKAKGNTTEKEQTQLTDDLRRSLGALHDFAPDDKRAVWIWNSAEDNASMNQAKGILHTSFWILGLLTLLSGIVGVSNIMLIAVKERTHEFGIRKALGARPWNIIRMVIVESVIITTFFGYIGMVCGVAFCEWMDATVGSQSVDIGVFEQKVFIDPTVDLSICLQATVVMIVAGALAGFFPARKAAKVKPIEALRG